MFTGIRLKLLYVLVNSISFFRSNGESEISVNRFIDRVSTHRSTCCWILWTIDGSSQLIYQGQAKRLRNHFITNATIISPEDCQIIGDV